MSSIKVDNGNVVIENTRGKDKTARGTVKVPLGAVKAVTVDGSIVRVHVDGVTHPVPKWTEGDVYNKYAVAYWSENAAEKVKAEIDWAIRSAVDLTIPEGWKPDAQGVKAIQSARKNGEYWTGKAGPTAKEVKRQEKAEREERRRKHQAELAHIHSFQEPKEVSEQEKLAPGFFDKGHKFGDIRVNFNGTITMNGTHYPAKGARAGVDMGMANHKKFGKGRLVMGAAAAPVVGLLAAPALIRKQKGIITLDVQLADGTVLTTVGNSGQGGVDAAQRVVKEIAKQAAK